MRRLFFSLLLATFTFSLTAQNEIPIIEKFEPGSILKVGTAPIGFLNHSGISVLNLSLSYEFKMGSRFTGQVNVTTEILGNIAADFWDIKSRRNAHPVFGTPPYFTKNQTALNFDFRYYLGKKGNTGFDGAYLGLRVNNLMINGTRYSDASTYHVTQAMPVIGLYLGYQKVFKNNTFIDFNIGYAPEDQFRYRGNSYGLPIDANATFGYRFKSLKNKETRILEKLKRKNN